MGTQSILLDNSTLNHCVRLLERGHGKDIDAEVYNASLYNLVNSIVLYKDIYMLETKLPASWGLSPLMDRLSSIIKKVMLEERDIYDLAETSFAKSQYFISSGIGCSYIHQALENSIRQCDRKKATFFNALTDNWNNSQLFENTEIRHIKNQDKNLRDLFILYCIEIYCI